MRVLLASIDGQRELTDAVDGSASVISRSEGDTLEFEVVISLSTDIHQPCGTESMVDYQERIDGALDKIRKRYPGIRMTARPTWRSPQEISEGLRNQDYTGLNKPDII